MDAIETAGLIRSGRMSAREAVEEAIGRAKQIDRQINAIVWQRFDAALEDARSGRFNEAGPLAGVPTLLKDFATPAAGEPEIEGNRVLRDMGLTASVDSSVVARLRKGGLISLGRSHSPEFAVGKAGAACETEAFGATRNPWRPELSTMGSSGGAAAAVAAGIVPVAHGNDAGGSIRMPASACGIVGLKPSRGRISWGPLAGEVRNGAATQGMLTRTVRDAALTLDILSGYETGDHYTAPPPERPFLEEIGREPGSLRIGFCADLPDGVVDPPCISAVKKAVSSLSALGHHVERAHPDAYFERQALLNHRAYVGACLASTLDGYRDRIGREWTADDMEDGSWLAYQQGKALSAADYLRIVRETNQYARRLASWWEEDAGFDLLVTPTLSAPPPAIGYLTEGDYSERRNRSRNLVAFTVQSNISGQPAISLPLHWTDDGIPIGVQLVARFAAEALLIRVAAQLEQALPWADRYPAIYAA
ncbi:amidase [Martelella sp. FLE1502]